MNKLYKVSQVKEIAVYGNEYTVANSSLMESFLKEDEGKYTITFEEVKDLSNLPKGWDEGTFVWGPEDEELTVEQALKRSKFDPKEWLQNNKNTPLYNLLSSGKKSEKQILITIEKMLLIGELYIQDNKLKLFQ